MLKLRILTALLVPFLAAASQGEELNRVNLLRVGQNGDGIRLVIETERAPQAQVYTRLKPERLIVEVVGAELPDDLRKPSPRAPWITSQSLQQDNLSRVRWTLNLRERIPASQIKTEVLSNPPRLVVDIAPYYTREETIPLSQNLKWIRRESANQWGYLLWNDVAFDPNDPGVRLDVGLAKDRLDARETVSSMMKRTGARVGVNGGYFATSGGPLGLVVKDGKVLAPHVGRRPARTVMALTKDRRIVFSRIAARGQKLVSLDGQTWSDILLALGGGPQLVHRGVVALTTDAEALGRSGNDITRSCGRTALATSRDGRMLLATAAGWHDTHRQGVKLDEMARLLIGRGAVEAMNLDGGASVDMVIGGQVVSAGAGSVTKEKPVATAVLVMDEAPATYPERIRIDLPDNSLLADGVSKTRLTAEVTTPTGEAVPDGTPIRFVGDRAGLSKFATTTKDGQAAVEVTSLRLPGPAVVRVECGGARAEATLRWQPGNAQRLMARLLSQKYVAPGQMASVMIQIDDEYGNPLGGVPFTCGGSRFATASDGDLLVEVPLPLGGGPIAIESVGLPAITVTAPAIEAPILPSPSGSPGKAPGR